MYVKTTVEAAHSLSQPMNLMQLTILNLFVIKYFTSVLTKFDFFFGHFVEGLFCMLIKWLQNKFTTYERLFTNNSARGHYGLVAANTIHHNEKQQRNPIKLEIHTKSTEFTQDLCASNLAQRLTEATSHTQIFPSALAEAAKQPSELTVIQLT